MPRDTTALLEAPNAEEIAIVDRMRELLATPERWHQGCLESEDGRALCYVGALKRADGLEIFDPFNISDAGRRVWEFSRDQTVTRKTVSIGRWNDSPNRTHADILDLLARVRRHFEEDA